MGTLRVDLIDGQEIRGVDRGGKSDPYVVFTFNGQKVHKSQTKKKTLTPEWNENFICPVVCNILPSWLGLRLLTIYSAVSCWC